MECDKRADVLRDALVDLKIPNELVSLKPPVFDRTDFGYTSDIDLVFFGTDKQKEELYEKLYNSSVHPFIVQIDLARLGEIQVKLPELYEYLTQRRGNFPMKKLETGNPITDFWEEEPELDKSARAILSSEDKLVLKEQRLEIGRRFVEEVKQRVPVVGYSFSGSTMGDMKRFGINSDLDIELLVDPKDEEDEKDIQDWIHLYLNWKYAEQFSIKVDAMEISLDFARQMISRDPKTVVWYEKKFGINASELKEK